MKNLLLTGRELSAHEATDLGLITEVVPLDQLARATRRKVLLMARMPREMHKMYLNRVYKMQDLHTATDYYLEQVAVLRSKRG